MEDNDMKNEKKKGFEVFDEHNELIFTCNTDIGEGAIHVWSDENHEIRQSLRMAYEPKEDITTYELAQCIPYLIHGKTPYEGDAILKEPFFRHFRIVE